VVTALITFEQQISKKCYSGYKTFWLVEELADRPTLCHVRRQGQAICFVLSISPIRSSVQNVFLDGTVISE
jgi:hypothetical protein